MNAHQAVISFSLAIQISVTVLNLIYLRRPSGRVSVKAVLTVLLFMIARQCLVLYQSWNSEEEVRRIDILNEAALCAVVIMIGIWSLSARKEGAAIETSGRLQTAVASGNMGIWDWDVRNNTLLLDDRLSDLYGLPLGVHPRRIEDWQESLHPEDRERAWDEFMAALRGEREYDTEFRIQHGTGAVKVIKANALVIRDRAGIAQRMIGLNRDITEQRWAEREIVNLNDTLERRVMERTRQLEAANELLRAEITERIEIEDKLKRHTAQLKNFSSRLMDARESERRHIAHELHDEIGQELTGLKLGLERVRRNADTATGEKLGAIQEQVEALMSRARDLSFNLRPSLLDDLGLVPALMWHFSRYTEQTGVKVIFHHTGAKRRFPQDMETVLFRVIQEALTNTARHAGVDETKVTLTTRGFVITACIEDKGAGFHPDAVLKSGTTLGITGMCERIEDAGGSLQIRSEPGKGTQWTIEIPLLCPLQRREGSVNNPCA